MKKYKKSKIEILVFSTERILVESSSGSALSNGMETSIEGFKGTIKSIGSTSAEELDWT